MKVKTCKECGKSFNVNKKNFKLTAVKKTKNKLYRDYSSRCLRNHCYQDYRNNLLSKYYHNKKEHEENKHLYKVLEPLKAEIGSKTEPYFEGENFGYIAPSYEEIKKEYQL
jgi:acetone carboxylase gamma subunit